MRTFAYGTDASFYRLNPKMVVKVRCAAALLSNSCILPCGTNRRCALLYALSPAQL